MTTIPHPLAASGRARPEHVICLADGGGAVRAAEMAQRVAGRASMLAAAGVTPASTVALLGPATWEWVCSWHALGWLGAAVAPLPVKATAAQWQERLASSDADHLIVTRDASDALRIEADKAAAAAAVGQLMLWRSADEAEASPMPERFWPLDETRLVVQTSGTTGAPQIARLTTAQLVFSAMGSMIRLGHDPNDRWLLCLPLHHVGGLAVLSRCAFYGTTAIVHDGFDAHRVAQAIDAGEVTQISLVPTMLRQLLDVRPDTPFPSPLRLVLLGGAPADEALLRRCRRLGVPLAVSWGMTEAASQIATAAPGELDTITTTATGAPPLACARVTVAGGASSGPLLVEGPIVAGGRMLTRDLGYVDAAGRVHVTGRADDLIISGGENIAPAQVEAVLLEHPAVCDAAVVGVVDAHWGQRPLAYVVAAAADGTDRPTDEVLTAWCLDRLERFKVPSAFVWRLSLPRDALGKLQRYALCATGTGSGGAVVSRQQADAAQGRFESLRHSGRLEVGRVDETMHDAGRAVLIPGFCARDVVGKANGSLTKAVNGDLNAQAVTHPHRAFEVRFSMHDGHRPAPVAQGALQITEHGSQHLFESSVTIFEKAAKEDDARAVNLIETGSDTMLECHSDTQHNGRWRA